MIFLIKYNRKLGTVDTMRTFIESDRNMAEDARLELELSLMRGGGPNYEVVLLEAEDESALRRTHRRYFENPGQIAST